MLKSIEKIKGLGIYEDYVKPPGTKEFAAKNLIFGWNYSGKTTLSRLFAKLETKEKHPDFKDCQFTFNSDADSITEKNLHESGLSVRVFNSDFVRNNLFFDSGSCNPILLLGKESEETQQKIGALSERIVKCDKTIRGIQRKIGLHTQSLHDERQTQARTIRQRLKIDPYTATHLGTDLIAIASSEVRLLSEKELVDAVDLATTPDSKKPLEVAELVIAPSIEAIHREAVALLSESPTFSNTIQHLEDHPEVERWVETGLRLHSDKSTCEFCRNEIDHDRIEDLRSHFSKDLSDHREKIEKLLNRVKTARIALDIPKSVELNLQFREAYEAACSPMAEQVQQYNLAIDTLIREVEEKVKNSRKPCTPSSLMPNLEKSLMTTANAINDVIRRNNSLATNFVHERAVARKTAKSHFVKEAADALEAGGWARKNELLREREARLDSFTKKLRIEIEQLQAKISQAQQGREKINERLASMLGEEAIEIRVTKDSTGQERFQLVRKNGAVAKNLSDGERTAIAFSYFLTKLKELDADVFKNTIVYIDDPISSLDSNHIFQVTAAINETFFAKLPVAGGNEAWSTTCRQLFVSTHNFEFFNLIRELPPAKESVARLFLVKRLTNGSSQLRDMPKSLSSYGSEYQYLFHCLYEFHNSQDKAESENLIILPNALRRFLELYTYSRIPGTHMETVDQRAVQIFGKEPAKAILKFLHMFSHGNTIERVAGNNELIFLLEQTVSAVFNELKENDNRHWAALTAAVVS